MSRSIEPTPSVSPDDITPYAGVAQQAAAMAVQDAAAHMRNAQTIASAVFAAAEEMILRNENPQVANSAISTAELAVKAAADNFEHVSKLAAALLAPPTGR